jgi:hypothetical protein
MEVSVSAALEFILGFLFNFAIAVVIVRFIYYPMTRNKAYVFTFLAFNTVIYFVLNFLTTVEISLGVGFGLFAIFRILRYRTDPIPVREMTYLFVIAVLPVMNSAWVSGGVRVELAFANLAVLAILYVLEKSWGFRYESYKRITYEKIELIKPENQHLLLADLQERTGLKIKRLQVGKVNFLRDVAEITVYYDDAEQSWQSAGGGGGVYIEADTDV